MRDVQIKKGEEGEKKKWIITQIMLLVSNMFISVRAFALF